MIKGSLTSISWALYDFANTIFSAVVLTAYFPLYISGMTGGQHWLLGAATTGSMLLAGTSVPFWGALSDSTGRTKNYLVKMTLVCLFFLCSLALFKQPLPLIAAFVVSSFFYHASLVFYHSLLAVAAKPEEQGFVSGLGTGLGYLGVVIALPIASWSEQRWGIPAVFLAAAALFFVFSLPLFFFVPERKAASTRQFRWNIWGEEWRKILEILRTFPRRPELLFFFLGNFLIMEALNGTIFWFAVYAREVFNPGSSAVIQMLIGMNAAAFLTGLIAGAMTDKMPARKILLFASAALVLTLFSLSIARDFATFRMVCFTAGAFAISGIWTAGRKVVVEIAPQEHLGAYFGIYNLTTKLSVISNLVFSVLAGILGFQAALLVLALPALAGVVCFRKIQPPRVRT